MAMVQLRSKAVGSIVKLKVSGTARNFIVVHQGRPSSVYDTSCDGTWLLMEDCYEKRTWDEGGINSYSASDIHSYLNGTFVDLFDVNIKNSIKQVKIPYRAGSGSGKTVTSGANGLSTKIFLLSSTEVAFSHDSMPTGEGAVLSYFSGCAADGNDSKRVAKIGGTSCWWYLRSPACGSAGSRNVIDLDGAGDWRSDVCSNSFGIRPALILPKSLLVADDGQITINTAPTVPASISIPSSISGGTTITVSWGASTDTQGNLEGYKVERSTNGGSSWSQIYQGSGRSTTNSVAFGTASVMYRVKAYDSEGLESSWKTSGQVTVFNNRAPGKPPSIAVPVQVEGGKQTTISWAAATDADGNLFGYALEQQVGHGHRYIKAQPSAIPIPSPKAGQPLPTVCGRMTVTMSTATT